MKVEVIKSLRFTKISLKDLDKLIEVPKDSLMGDYAFPCFSLSKQFKKNPAEIARELSKKIKLGKNFEKIDIKGSYINFFLNRERFAGQVIDRITKEKDNYGRGKHSKKKVMIEFSQPNTHKAFHVGHVRGTSLGESIARINEFCGNKVLRANYSGDTGMHIAKWIWCYTKYHSKKELSDDERFFANIYSDAIGRLEKNENWQNEVEKINKKLDSRSDKELNKIWKETRKLSIKSWDKIYHELNTKFDIHFFESDVEKAGKKIAKELVKKNIAEISDGATIIDFVKAGKPNLGVLVLLRKDGTVLYGSKDLALAKRKFYDFKIDESIYVIGREQDMYIHQIFETLKLINKNKNKSIYVPVSEVRLPWGKMSSRTGDNVLYSDFKKELVEFSLKEIEKRFENLDNIEIYDRALAVTIASLKYSMLKQDTNKNLIFDKKKTMKFEGDTGPYLLYSYARSQSILKKAAYKKQKKFKIKDINNFEKNLVSNLAIFPEVVRASFLGLAPNIIANYSYKLAKSFSEFYHNCKVIDSEKEQFRLKLVDSFSQTLKNSLYLIGIQVIPEM